MYYWQENKKHNESSACHLCMVFLTSVFPLYILSGQYFPYRCDTNTLWKALFAYNFWQYVFIIYFVNYKAFKVTLHAEVTLLSWQECTSTQASSKVGRRQVTWCATLSPGPSPRSKWQVRETPGQGCWNTSRIVEYFVSWHMMKWLFQRLFPAYGGPLCFLQSETIVQTKRRHFVVFMWQNSNEFLEPYWQPWPEVSPTHHFEWGEGPGDEVSPTHHFEWGEGPGDEVIWCGNLVPRVLRLLG